MQIDIEQGTIDGKLPGDLPSEDLFRIEAEINGVLHKHHWKIAENAVAAQPK